MKPLDFDELSLSLNQISQKLDHVYAMMIDCYKEDIEIFFTELLHKSLQNPAEIAERYTQLHLDIPLENCSGFFFQITLDDASLSQWKYERESISTALQNGLQMILQDYTVYHLFRTGRNYYFVTLSAQKIPPFSADHLCDILFSLLHFHCKMQIIAEFDHISDFFAAPEVAAGTAFSLPYPDTCIEKLRREEASCISAQKPIIQKAIEYIRTHYAQDLTREDVADTVYLSPSYFSKLFKQYTGMSFTDYLTTVRMEEAAALLKTPMRVNEIGFNVGYQSRNRFFINFRQYSGYSPTEYRRHILQMEDIPDETEK